MLPTARQLAAALVAVASVIHLSGRLPDADWVPRIGWTLALVLLLLLLLPALMSMALPSRVPAVAERRAGSAIPGIGAGNRFVACPVSWSIALMLASLLLLWQIHAALQARLPASLEGRTLELVGRVDGMPQRFEFGNRIRMTLFECRVVGAEEGGRADAGDGGDSGDGGGGGGDSGDGGDIGSGSGSGSGGGCGRLERVQLDWGRQREKDRASAASDRASAAEDWPRPGQYWRLTARLKRPVAPVNPDAFDLELRYLQQGVGGLGRVEARTRLHAPPAGAAWRPWSGLLVRFEAWRAALRDRLETVHAHRVGTARDGDWSTFGIVVALALGEQGAIGAGLWGLFSRTGVSHLMAISGMHVTMLALVAAWLAGRLLGVLARRRFPGVSRLLGAHPRQVLVLLIAVTTAFAYALLSGWGIPSQRTCWMLSAAALMTLLGRGGGSLDVTLLAAAIVVAMDPWAVATAGFWLSFGAVAAILWCAHGVDESSGVIRYLPGAASSRVWWLPCAMQAAANGRRRSAWRRWW